MPKITIIVWLTDAMRNGSPVMFVRGRSGLEHRYVWNAKHEKHILDNKEFTPEEWNKLSVEIQGGRQESFFRPVVKVIVTEDAAAPVDGAPSSAPASLQDTSVAEDRTHNPEVVGSNPTPAPIRKQGPRRRGPDKKPRKKAAPPVLEPSAV